VPVSEAVSSVGLTAANSLGAVAEASLPVAAVLVFFALLLGGMWAICQFEDDE